MRTDTLFYQIFQTMPEVLFELTGQPASEAEGYQFQSVELKETAKRIDGVLLPPEEAEKQIYFAEVQFQSDKDLYYRLFTEIFLYIGQKKATQDWRAIAIYAQRSIEPEIPRPYQWLITASPHVYRVYLDELGDSAYQSVGLGLIKLIVEAQENAIEKARQLYETVQARIEDQASQRRVLQLIETILITKLPLTREEVEAMFSLDELKNTRYFQQVAEEYRREGLQQGVQQGKLESVPRLLQLGLTVAQIAGALQLDIEVVRRIAQQQPNNSDNE
ncbi:Rpn family recombination-promoting nuclease/putative transposase [Ancylothrix sp. C2]|uniref:Rpn family recombination-promoting nuclease/putative transposase n=1 Tax=Ancylothrix sp. D3o TaxID=2953691 RepID=UPI0021BA8687|nr:Rpn family recombination-promoting nuclease/putative transposase [Ancylothrix sp. D3o]MCT7949065.1 Rpn family recombination-promoting nuclease/putative transposase [Ancylothrix sp. D3o]